MDTTDIIPEGTRQDSENLAQLTPAHSLGDLFADLTTEEAKPVLVDLLTDEQYADIKALVTSEDLFFHSTLYLEPTVAKEKVLNEEVMFRIATTVRQQSKETAQLMPVTALAPVLSELDFVEIDRILPALMEDARYQDIQTVSISSGAVFLYSRRHITENYAQFLARIEAGDPLATIAETVRDESRIYPRPTNVLLFTEPPFNMRRDEIPGLVDQLLEQGTYDDIKKIVASTGIVYLHSERHLSGVHARSLVEWQEVGQHENP
jgi:hypothetical protein